MFLTQNLIVDIHIIGLNVLSSLFRSVNLGLGLRFPCNDLTLVNKKYLHDALKTCQILAAGVWH